MKKVNESWNTAYEWKAVALLSIGFGLVGIDRFMIMPLFPIMVHERHFDYQDLGYIAGALAVAWGFSSIFMGNLSDRIGHRKVVIPAMLVFSLLCGASGFASSLGTLILIRVRRRSRPGASGLRGQALRHRARDVLRLGSARRRLRRGDVPEGNRARSHVPNGTGAIWFARERITHSLLQFSQ